MSKYTPTIGTFDKVFQNLKQELNLAEGAPVLDCGLLMSSTIEATVHLGPNDIENL